MAFIVSAAIFVFFHEGHSIYRARLLREILGGDCVGPCHDEDYVAIGIPYLLQARFAEAQQWFDRMCNPNPSMIGLRAIAIFGQGRIDEAFNEYRKSLNAAQANSAIDISVYMLGDSAILFHPDKHNLRLLIKEGIRLRIKDSTLFCAVRQYMILFGPASKEEIFNGADVPYQK